MRVLILLVVGLCLSLSNSSPSFDPLIASQCRARCLSLYPWKLSNSSSSEHFDSNRNYRSMYNGIRRIQRVSPSCVCENTRRVTQFFKSPIHLFLFQINEPFFLSLSLSRKLVCFSKRFNRFLFFFSNPFGECLNNKNPLKCFNKH